MLFHRRISLSVPYQLYYLIICSNENCRFAYGVRTKILFPTGEDKSPLPSLLLGQISPVSVCELDWRVMFLVGVAKLFGKFNENIAQAVDSLFVFFLTVCIKHSSLDSVGLDLEGRGSLRTELLIGQRHTSRS